MPFKTADHISIAMGGRGNQYFSPFGNPLEQMCSHYVAETKLEDGKGRRWDFEDGSSIVDDGNSWRMEGDGRAMERAQDKENT